MAFGIKNTILIDTKNIFDFVHFEVVRFEISFERRNVMSFLFKVEPVPNLKAKIYKRTLDKCFCVCYGAYSKTWVYRSENA